MMMLTTITTMIMIGMIMSLSCVTVSAFFHGLCSSSHGISSSPDAGQRSDILFIKTWQELGMLSHFNLYWRVTVTQLPEMSLLSQLRGAMIILFVLKFCCIKKDPLMLWKTNSTNFFKNYLNPVDNDLLDNLRLWKRNLSQNRLKAVGQNGFASSQHPSAARSKTLTDISFVNFHLQNSTKS